MHVSARTRSELSDVDDVSRVNRVRWNALARANVAYSRPLLSLTVEEAARRVDGHGVLGNVAGKRVLCLASGGGQDSAAFGLLGADVTVLDLSDEQLERDRLAAAHYGLRMTTLQGDMRDLSTFSDGSFDIVRQAYSINFVPSVAPVFDGVVRVLRSGGLYALDFANPFAIGVDDEAWDGHAYPLDSLYVDGEDIAERYPQWHVGQPGGAVVDVDSPHEYRHALSTVLNSLTERGFLLLGLWEDMEPEEDPIPGSWAHFTRTMPPWFNSFWRLERR